MAAPGSGHADIVVSSTFPATCANSKTCNKPVTSTNARGFVTDYTYDPNHGGTLTQTLPAAADGVRPSHRYSYTLSGGTYRLTEQASCRTLASCTGTADELKTVIGYGTANMLTTSITAMSGTGSPSATFSAAYDDLGNLSVATDPLGGTEHLFYDLDRRVTGLITPDPDGGGALPRRALRYSYNNAGLPTNVERGSVSGTTSGDVAAMAAVQSLSTDYDGQGRKWREADKAGGTAYTTVQYGYDAAGRLECSAIRMNPAGYGSLPSSACALSAAGADGPDRISRFYYDAAGRPMKLQLAYATADQSDEESLTYSPDGQVATHLDGENNLTTFEYDGHARLLKTRFPATAKGAATSSATDFEEFTLDASGNVTQRRLRDGQLIGFTYDALNRMIAKDLPSPEADVAYSYDLQDRPLAVTQGRASVAMGYDALGRLISESSAFGTLTFENDALGRRTRTTWPDTFYISRDYLATGELKAIRENGALSGIGVLASYNFDAIGRPTGLVRGNGATTTYSTDALSRRTGVATDLAGTAHDVSITLSYNPANQVRQLVRDNDAYAWAQHHNVNRPYSSNGLNQLTAAGAVTLLYNDLRGNLTHSGSNVYGYSAENRLITAPGGVTLGYDPTGRLAQTSGAATTRFQYEGEALVAEYNGANIMLRRYVHGPGTDEPLVWYEGAGTSDRRWLHHDERGSVIGVSNASGTVTAVNAYDEFGIPGAAHSGRFQYTGQVWLPEAGLYYFKARMYSPTLGRFLQTDPTGFAGGINLYGYADGDPINVHDPKGTHPVAVVVIGCARIAICRQGAIAIGRAVVREVARRTAIGPRAVPPGVRSESNEGERPRETAKQRRERQQAEERARRAERTGGEPDGDGPPRNNQAQNREFDHIVKELNLTEEQAERLHREVSKKG